MLLRSICQKVFWAKHRKDILHHRLMVGKRGPRGGWESPRGCPESLVHAAQSLAYFLKVTLNALKADDISAFGGSLNPSWLSLVSHGQCDNVFLTDSLVEGAIGQYWITHRMPRFRIFLISQRIKRAELVSDSHFPVLLDICFPKRMPRRKTKLDLTRPT